MLSLDLATRGINPAARFSILKRHIYAFARHLTARKLANFAMAEFNRVTKKTRVNSYPFILKVESSNICNLRCAYCYDGRRAPEPGERPYGRMSFPEFKQIIDEIGRYLFKINLYGFGEPFLFPETFEMIEYATRNNIGVGVSSNMNVDDPDLGRKIVESGLEVLIFSCHGVTQESYSKFMVKGDMELAFRNIERVIEERKARGKKTPMIDWQYCVTRFNQNEIEMAREKARKLGIDQVRFIKPFMPDDADDEWFSEMFPRQAIGAEEGPPGGCAWVYRSAYVNFDGGLIPCCRDTRNMASDFGNVIKEGFMNVWNNEKYQAARRLISCPTDESARIDMICSRCPVTKPRG